MYLFYQKFTHLIRIREKTGILFNTGFSIMQNPYFTWVQTCQSGGGEGIRTLDTLRYTRFPSERNRPLCDPSSILGSQDHFRPRRTSLGLDATPPYFKYHGIVREMDRFGNFSFNFCYTYRYSSNP